MMSTLALIETAWLALNFAPDRKSLVTAKAVHSDAEVLENTTLLYKRCNGKDVRNSAHHKSFLGQEARRIFRMLGIPISHPFVLTVRRIYIFS